MNLHKSLARKGIAFIVILLFIGVSVIHSTSTIVEKKSNILPFNEGSLLGYVNDNSMNPIEGARVRVCFHGTYEENFSDSLGYYHVTNIPICNCTKNCTVFKEGYKPECVWLSIYKNTTYDFVLTYGNILYVGGSGEGNYTRIQDAINDASDGDTVFVFDNSSPYYEAVVVNKTINLIGEDKNTTIIDGSGTDTWRTIHIECANGVNVSRFTIRNTGHGFGIEIDSKYNNISNNIIGPNHTSAAVKVSEPHNNIYGNTIINEYGIHSNSGYNFISRNSLDIESYGIEILQGDGNIITYNTLSSGSIISIINIIGNNNTISHNIISNCDDGICVTGGKNSITHNTISTNISDLGVGIKLSMFTGVGENVISGNTLNYNWAGIAIYQLVSRTIVTGNTISNNTNGLFFHGSGATITRNTISNNDIGIESFSNRNTVVSENNIMNNSVNACYRYDIIEALFGNTNWNANYWGSPKEKPVPILGGIGIIFCPIPWFPQHDKNPAQEPYDIEVCILRSC